MTEPPTAAVHRSETPLATAPRGRFLVHPGPTGRVRIDAMRADAPPVGRAPTLRLVPEPHAGFAEALIAPLRALGITAASLTLCGGRFERLRYCVAPADPSGERVANYQAPIDAGAATLIFGTAMLGVSTSGAPLVHVHATFVDAAGRVRGGHLVGEACTLGDAPPSVQVTVLDGIELRLGHDAETNLPLMRPFRRADAVAGEPDGGR